MAMPWGLGLISVANCRITPYNAFVFHRKTICRLEFIPLLQPVRFEAPPCRLLFDPSLSPSGGIEHLYSGYLFVDVAPLVQTGAA